MAVYKYTNKINDNNVAEIIVISENKKEAMKLILPVLENRNWGFKGGVIEKVKIKETENKIIVESFYTD
jgi:hypothetical protein